MKKKLNLIVGSAFFLSVITTYQNCGVEQQGSYFRAQSFSTLPYEMKVDQLAYLSCAEQSNVANEPGVFFTFRGGAYGTDSGVRVSENFLYETRNMTVSRKMDLLYADLGTSLSRLQFSVRKQNSLGSMFVNADSGGGSEEIDFDYVFGDFGSDAMSASLLTMSPTNYMNYWAPAGINKDAYFEGSLVFNSSETLAQQVRQFLSSDGILTFAFADVTQPEKLRTPADYVDVTSDNSEPDPASSRQALGLGFKLKFKQPYTFNWGYSGAAHVNMPKRVIESVDEIDLTTGSAVNGQWSCPNDMQFRVLFPDDIWKVGAVKDPANDNNFEDNPGATSLKLCPQRNDAHSDNQGTNAALLAKVRQSLPVSDWYVNMRYKCVIPKRFTKGSCYGIDSGINDTRSPEYNLKAQCNPDINSTGVGVCSHFLSICYKP